MVVRYHLHPKGKDTNVKRSERLLYNQGINQLFTRARLFTALLRIPHAQQQDVRGQQAKTAAGNPSRGRVRSCTLCRTAFFPAAISPPPKKKEKTEQIISEKSWLDHPSIHHVLRSLNGRCVLQSELGKRRGASYAYLTHMPPPLVVARSLTRRRFRRDTGDDTAELSWGIAFL